MLPFAVAGIVAVLAVLLVAPAAPPDDKAERLARHRNLGKAFFENPTTQAQAVEEFRKAMELAPESARERLNHGLALLAAGRTAEGIAEIEKVQAKEPRIPHTWFNLGVQYKKAGDYERAVRQLEQMVKLVPEEPVSHYNLGTLYKLAGRTEEAIREFETASRLDANLAGPHFQLFNMFRQAGRAEEARQRLALFQQIKKQQENAATPEDMDWSFYSEILDEVETAAPPPPKEAPRFAVRRLHAGSGGSAGLLAADLDGDGTPELVSWSGGKLWSSREAGLGNVTGVVSAAAGDFNNDGLADLCVVTTAGPVLLRNEKGRMTRVGLPKVAGSFRVAVWLDYDHDYDLDLILLGDQAALIRNQGEAGFADRTADFPFVAGKAAAAAVLRVVPDSKGMDLAVSYADREGVLYRDNLGGKYKAEALAAMPPSAASIQAIDADHSGTVDLLVNAGGRGHLLLNPSRDMKAQAFRAVALPAAGILTDPDSRGVADLVSGGAVYRNLGNGRFGEPQTVAGLAGVAWAEADFTKDGRADLAAVGAGGEVQQYTNQAGGKNGWVAVSLAGIKNPKLALGSEVEVRAGQSYQKRMYAGYPLVFGLGEYREADAIRITWPNGLIQHEAKQPGQKAHAYKEAQRLSGSCPQVWTWNGREFEYITDVLGVAPLGASAGDGGYFPVDHLEHVQINAEQLKARDGFYEVRLTEELSEIAYIDQIRLMAVDHPAELGVHVNEKFQGPPYPELKIYTTKGRRYPVAARDNQGRDVLRKLLRKDRTYPDAFERTEAGVAKMHSLDLDFGVGGRENLLVLDGWVDWADGSTFLGYAQSDPRGLVMPRLKAMGSDGKWRTLVEDMGMPAGKPKRIVVETGGARRMRIVTNLALYWDEIYLSAQAEERARVSEMLPRAAELRFRGFSRVEIHPERKQPEMFFYPRPVITSMWNPTPGMYTRYGDVAELTAAADDRFVIMGSGDELRLRFEAGALPAVAEGMRRSFVLAVDGWAKDRDANTAYSQTVEPLPFHGMSRYPYPEMEKFPDTAAHREWRRTYNTRPALRLIRPLKGD